MTVSSLEEMKIDPASVPTRLLASGDGIPAVGLGTFGSDRYSGEQIATSVKTAVAMGYRHIDCASVYGNEHLIGEALQEVMETTPREELWINSKVWNDMQSIILADVERDIIRGRILLF